MHSTHRSTAAVFVALVVGLLLTTFSSVASATAYPCTQSGLDTAFKNGGLATFTCAAATVIKVPVTQQIVTNMTLDGGGLLTLSGDDSVVPLGINSGITATVQNITIQDGMSGSWGGNISDLGTLTLKNSIVQGGTDGAGGAVLVESGATATIDSCSIINNTDGPEGAIAVHGTATIINSTISGNSHRGVSTRGGNATVTYSTIVANGEDLFSLAAGDVFTVGHSLLVAPTINSNIAAIDTATVNSQGYNILSGDSAVKLVGVLTGNQTGVSPSLGKLQLYNGGTTPTLALLACSPGINAGATTGGPTVDQNGQPRKQQGAIDVGAYETALLPCVSAADVSVVEGNTGSKSLGFVMQLSGVSTLPVSVNASIADGTATNFDHDYSGAADGTFPLTPGTTSTTFTTTVFGDTNFETDETILFTITSASNATISDANATGTITNDDAQPTISIGDLSIGEGGGTAIVPVTLSNTSYQTITVNYATADGTATAGSDYTTKNGTLTFGPGISSQNVSVAILEDLIAEGNETFTVNLATPANATIADGSGTVTILDDEGNPGVTIGSASTVEGNAGTTVLTIPVTLNPATAQTVTVDYATVDGTATTADSDYVTASGTLTFTPGSTSQTIQVTVNGDLQHEADETFTIHLSNAAGAAIASADGTITITNDDAIPSLSIAPVIVAEGNTGASNATFTVTLSAPTSDTVTVHWATADGTATVADDDYTAGAGDLTFTPGVLTQTMDVSIQGDDRFEGDETFTVTLSAPANATLGQSVATGTITNDDTAPIADAGTSTDDAGTSSSGADGGGTGQGSADAGVAVGDNEVAVGAGNNGAITPGAGSSDSDDCSVAAIGSHEPSHDIAAIGAPFALLLTMLRRRRRRSRRA